MDFSTRLNEALDASGLNQADLAERTGTSQANVSRYVSGKVVPNLTTAIRLACALGVSLDWLCGRSACMRPMTQKDAEVLEAFNRLSEHRKEVMLDLMDW